MKDYKELLIEEDTSLLDALMRIEKAKNKILFVVSNGKLKAALSDGDVRRWLISEGRLDAKVRDFANYTPVYVYEDKKDKVYSIMRNTYLDVVPIVNQNMEIIDIAASASVPVEEERISDKIPVVINAGGKGIRLYPYTKILPKPLIPIGEIPISEHIINRFENIGIKDFYMIVNEKKEMIKAYYSSVKCHHITFVDEDIPLGTGGGLSLLEGEINHTFIFVNCDTILLTDFAKILKQHYEKKNYITVICAEMKFTIPYGVVNSNDDCFNEITEKPQMFFQTNVGCYIIEPGLLNFLPKNTAMDFPDTIVCLKKQGYRIGIYLIDEEEWLDMGQFHTLEDMKKRLRVE